MNRSVTATQSVETPCGRGSKSEEELKEAR